MKWIMIGYILYRVLRLVWITLLGFSTGNKSSVGRARFVASIYDRRATRSKLKAIICNACGFMRLRYWFEIESAGFAHTAYQIRVEANCNEGAG